jgi:hypothetical protein
MKRRVYHVVGTTQWLGTCKMHLFEDCHQLQKKRVQQMAWGPRDSTGATETAEWDVEMLTERRVCRICARRATP